MNSSDLHFSPSVSNQFHTCRHQSSASKVSVTLSTSPCFTLFELVPHSLYSLSFLNISASAGNTFHLTCLDPNMDSFKDLITYILDFLAPFTWLVSFLQVLRLLFSLAGSKRFRCILRERLNLYSIINLFFPTSLANKDSWDLPFPFFL